MIVVRLLLVVTGALWMVIGGAPSHAQNAGKTSDVPAYSAELPVTEGDIKACIPLAYGVDSFAP